MIPVKDAIPTKITPIVNYMLIAANVIVFILMFSLSDAALETAFYTYAMTPSHFADGVTIGDVLTIFSSMFMHAGFAHIFGNMAYLAIFGDNVEDHFGHGQYLMFYLVGGVVASLTHIATNWGSDIPTVGASGAISAVLGAYLVYFPSSRIATWIPLGPFYKQTILPAAVVLSFWFIMQLFDGVAALGGSDVDGVAVWAHIGGFVAGVIMAKLPIGANRSNKALTW